jgi:hypothetical protein
VAFIRTTSLISHGSCPEKARLSLEKAFSLDRSDARIGMELDQLYKRLNLNPKLRWAFLEENHTLVEKRDDLFLEKVTLLNLKGRYEEAYSTIMSRQFHPWEGGEGIVSEQYVWCLTELAKKAIQSGHFPEALRNNLYHKGAHIHFKDLNISFPYPHLEG